MGYGIPSLFKVDPLKFEVVQAQAVKHCQVGDWGSTLSSPSVLHSSCFILQARSTKTTIIVELSLLARISAPTYSSRYATVVRFGSGLDANTQLHIYTSQFESCTIHCR